MVETVLVGVAHIWVLAWGAIRMMVMFGGVRFRGDSFEHVFFAVLVSGGEVVVLEVFSLAWEGDLRYDSLEVVLVVIVGG